MGKKSSSPPAPNYAPVAQASNYAADLSYKLGKEQLDESRRQYNEEAPVANEVAQAQLGLMHQSKEQGDDYYNYMVENQRPVESALQKEAMTGKADAATQAAMDEAAATAVADARSGSTQAINQIIRQGVRYNISADKMADTGGAAEVSGAAARVAAANGARLQKRSEMFAKRLDVAGLYRGMSGASQGAYGVAMNSGNSATANKMAPGNQLIAGMQGSNNTIMQGQGQKISGLGSVLSAQTSAYNASQSSGGSDPVLGMIGTGLGALAGGGFKLPSDRRLKENIELVGVDERTGLNIYEFNYIGGVNRYRGVMADEVQKFNPDAVETMDDGYMVVDYSKLGLEMTEVSHG